MPLFTLKVNSFIGADTRITLSQERSPRKELFPPPPLDRNPENETTVPETVSPLPSPNRHRSGKRTQTRLTRFARQSIQRIGAALASEHPPEEILFLTGTFPGESFDAQKAIASQAGWIASRLKAWLYKRLGSNLAFYVWEFQRRGTLHLHYVVAVPDSSLRAAIVRDFRSEWIRLIQGASLRSSENLFIGRRSRNFFLESELLQVYAQECRKSPGGYLAKYLSKNAETKFPAPARLWGATREARHLVARNCISLVIPSLSLSRASDLADEIESWAECDQSKIFSFRHRFTLGKTVVFYDDSIRCHLVPPKPTSSDEELIACCRRLHNKLLQVGLVLMLFDYSSKPLKGRLLEWGAGVFDVSDQATGSSLSVDLGELKALISLVAIEEWYHRSDLINLVDRCLKLI